MLVMSLSDAYPESRLVAVTGPQDSGKGTIGKYLASRGFMHVSTGNVLRAEADRRGLDHERNTLIDIAVGWRLEHNDIGVLVVKAIDQWREQADTFPSGLALDGLRLPAEAQAAKSEGGVLGYIDAPIDTRYQWSIERARGSEADKTFEEFAAHDWLEYEGVGDPLRPCLRDVKRMADFVIENAGTKEELCNAVAQSLGIQD